MPRDAELDLTPWVPVTVLAVLALLPFVLPPHLLASSVILVLYLALALSWNLCSGYTGYVSFGHHGFFGVGAYTVGLLGKQLGGPWWLWTPIVGGLMSAALALPLGAILMRIRGVYFAIATLGFAEVAYLVTLNWDGLTKGTTGVFVGNGIQLEREYAALYLVVMAVTAVTWWLERSAFGLRVMAMRDDEEAAAAMGIDTVRQKIALFTASAFFAGLAGGAFVDHMAHLLPENVFAVRLTLISLLLAVAGGIGSLAGTMVGSILLGTGLLTISVKVSDFQAGAVGLLVLLISMLAPGGIAAGLPRLGVTITRRRCSPARRFLREQTPETVVVADGREGTGA